ncbi:MAG TPA: hypothetical protein VF297_10940, partial [Pyrinomonadaceae bacterium]
MFFAASSHSSLQYLLPSAAGQPQVSRAHLFFGLSSAISTSSFSTVPGRGNFDPKFRPETPEKSRRLRNADFGLRIVESHRASNPQSEIRITQFS